MPKKQVEHGAAEKPGAQAVDSAPGLVAHLAVRWQEEKAEAKEQMLNGTVIRTTSAS